MASIKALQKHVIDLLHFPESHNANEGEKLLCKRTTELYNASNPADACVLGGLPASQGTSYKLQTLASAADLEDAYCIFYKYDFLKHRWAVCLENGALK